MENTWNNLVDGLRGYCKDNGFKKVVLGLSGGLDSAVVSVLATQALGKENVVAIMMKTQFTSDLSINIARNVAKLNGFEYQEVDIQPLIDVQRKYFAEMFDDEPDDLVMQNLQARQRGMILMSYSNQFGNLVLACGNKSEIAMGYCTLYGDTCGGLAPIGNIYKSDLFEIAKWQNSIKEQFPIEAINRAPSAELKEGQKDEDSIPSYALLDKILKLYLDEGCDREFILQQGFDAKTVDFVIMQYNKMLFKQKQLPLAL
ncbi:MAG: NAD(+) synthase [Alphaproteobacteria bacterium]